MFTYALNSVLNPYSFANVGNTTSSIGDVHAQKAIEVSWNAKIGTLRGKGQRWYEEIWSKIWFYFMHASTQRMWTMLLPKSSPLALGIFCQTSKSWPSSKTTKFALEFESTIRPPFSINYRLSISTISVAVPSLFVEKELSIIANVISPNRFLFKL